MFFFSVAGLPNAVSEFQKFHSLFSSIFKIKAIAYTWGQKQQQNQALPLDWAQKDLMAGDDCSTSTFKQFQLLL